MYFYDGQYGNQRPLSGINKFTCQMYVGMLAVYYDPNDSNNYGWLLIQKGFHFEHSGRAVDIMLVKKFQIIAHLRELKGFCLFERWSLIQGGSHVIASISKGIHKYEI